MATKKSDRQYRVKHAFPRKGVWWTRQNQHEIQNVLTTAELDELEQGGNIVRVGNAQESAELDEPTSVEPAKATTRKKE